MRPAPWAAAPAGRMPPRRLFLTALVGLPAEPESEDSG